MTIFRAAILTAKEVEFNAVRQHLVEVQRVDDTFDGTVYRRGKIRAKAGSEIPIEHWDVAIYRTGRGQQPTNYGTQVLIQHFRPDILLYVGVAGGDPSEPNLSIGDVIVGKVVRYYERTSQHQDNFVIKDETYAPNRALVNAAAYEADEAQWLTRVTGERRNSKIFVGEIASGEKVQKSASSALWVAIKARFPDVIAVETEGHGFHYAVAQSAARGIMIRSISDFLDNKDDDSDEHGSDDDRQALASDHAAAFAINLIANLNTTFLQDLRQTKNIRYAVIIKISADSVEGVISATRLLADAINDPHLTVESLEPANSFILRISTKLQSAAYAHAIFRGGLISELLGIEVTSLQSDAERTGERGFDEFLEAIIAAEPRRLFAVQRTFIEAYPSWRAAALAVERIVIAKSKVKQISPESSNPRRDGQHIRELRYKVGLTMKQLAAEVGVDSSTISKIESGRITSGPTLAKLWKYLEGLNKNSSS